CAQDDRQVGHVGPIQRQTNAKTMAGKRYSFPPIAMRLRWMGHPLIGGGLEGKATAKAECRDLSTTQQTMGLSVASVEMTILGAVWGGGCRGGDVVRGALRVWGRSGGADGCG